jgi:hypothetical protein
MTTGSITSITDGQKKQYLRFIEDAAERALKDAALDKDGLQKLIEQGDEMQARIVAGIKELSAKDKFADEEVPSSFVYPKDFKVKGIAEQIAILGHFFPDIGSADGKIAEQPLPADAEGWFAIPKWQTLAPTYGEAVKKVFSMLATTRREFYNHGVGKLGSEFLRQHARTVKMFQKLGREQKDHDILVVPAQFGLHHKGRSVHRAREVFAANEFGLGAFALGIMLLTHVDCRVHWDRFHVDCAGDEFLVEEKGFFPRVPAFVFSGVYIEFYVGLFGGAYANHGSATAFISQ